MKLTQTEINRIAIECGHAMECEGFTDDTLWFDGNLTEFARKIEATVLTVHGLSKELPEQPQNQS